jgi:hypothetical protein
MNGQGTTVNNLVAATQRWIHQPFSTTMNLWDLFLLVGIVLVFAVLWGRILAHIGE